MQSTMKKYHWEVFNMKNQIQEELIYFPVSLFFEGLVLSLLVDAVSIQNSEADLEKSVRLAIFSFYRFLRKRNPSADRFKLKIIMQVLYSEMLVLMQ